jgi:ComF family protein
MALYEGPVKEAIHKFKFRGKKDLAPVFAELLQGYARASSFMSLVLGVDLAVPVPLFAARQKERGFNQSELIAELFCDRLNIPFSKDVIRRGRQTKPQFDLKRADRFLNVSSAFTPTHGHDIAGKTVLLIDDILTTGATASECAKTLKSNGASRVFVLTLSRALED